MSYANAAFKSSCLTVWKMTYYLAAAGSNLLINRFCDFPSKASEDGQKIG